MKILVDTAGDILYKSYYLLGLIQLFGERNVQFSGAPFRSLSCVARNGKATNFIVCDGTRERRYTIAGDDSYVVNAELYDWCDLYGSVNANRALTPEEQQAKLVTLCPSFAVRYAEPVRMTLDCLGSLPARPLQWKKHLGKYKRLLQRMPYGRYQVRGTVREGYVFTSSTLWYSDEWNKNDEQVNLARARFIRACRTLPGITLEGGLVSQGSGRSSEELFRDCLSDRYPVERWIELTRQSVCVFNTPAFWNCHGWKLGEYMALGKAIVSTPLINDLPQPLEHGRHIHITENSEEAFGEAVSYINSHPDYRRMLEENITNYWERYGTPVASLALLGIQAP